MDLAQVSRLLEALPANFAVGLPDGQWLGTAEAAAVVSVVFRNEQAVARLAEAPSLLRFAEAFVGGEIDVRGDFLAAVTAAYATDALGGPGAAGEALPRPPDEDAIGFHYDRSSAFFALFLDARLTYTCAYYRAPDVSLDEAQAAKLDLVCRKLRLAPGERLLDVGCGWGALTARAAERYGAQVSA